MKLRQIKEDTDMRIDSMATLAVILGLGVVGCSSMNTQRLEFHNDYFVREATERTFVVDRTFPDGSTVTGTLTYAITEVQWPETLPGTYAMSGTVARELKGRVVSREAAISVAPHSAIKTAMNPANVAEVFTEKPSDQANIVLVETDWSKLGELKLPLEFTLDNGQPRRFSSALQGQTMGWAIEIALVWLKDIQVRCGLSLSGTYSLTAIDESHGWVKLSLQQTLPGGDNHRYEMFFMRSDSLQQVDAELADGSKLTLRKPM
jgi:hypothetical protein